jgi:DNA-3-methyladenine glycosylase I
MSFPYKQVFEKAEEALLAYGSKHRAPQEIRASLDTFKTFEGRRLSDDQFFSILTAVVFYSGFRAATVTARMKVIERHFPDWKTVSGFTEREIAQVLSDPEMIRNERKVAACVKNANLFRTVIGQHGSFQHYIESFRPTDSFENLMLLKEELEGRFHYIGGITAYHFLTDVGLPVLKPDRVISRIFFRLGAIDDEGQLLETVIQGRRFAEATGLPIRYIDIVFVAYGQAQSPEFGIDRGICLKEPRCQACGLTGHCRYYEATKVQPTRIPGRCAPRA